MECLKWGYRLSLVVAVVLATTTNGDLLTYNVSTKQLHFRCPQPHVDGDIMLMQLSRVGPPEIQLANWTKEGAFAEDGRITTLPASAPYLLEAVMDHVTCLDSDMYKCAMLVDNDRKGVHSEIQKQPFNYTGEVMAPISSKTPLKPRYTVGEKVKLQCEARIGTDDNTFVWESRLPGEEFSKVTNEDPCTKIEQVKIPKVCEIEARTTLELQLSDTDDGREWRCRLQKSQHKAYFTVAVDCLGTDGCLVSCRAERPEPQDQVAAVDTPTKGDTGRVETSVDKQEKPEDGPCRAERPEPQGQVAAVDTSTAGGTGRVGKSVDEQEIPKNDPSLTTIVMIIVLPISFTISLIAVITVCRKKRDKHPPPLVVMESPPDTEYGESITSSLFPVYSPPPSRASRRLPDLPTDDDSHTTFTTANDDYADFGDESTPKKTPTCPPRPSSSVYVSMSAINTLESAGERVGNGVGSHPGGREERGIPAFERSMSVYSNTLEAARSRANSDDGGTQMRVHATYKKELA